MIKQTIDELTLEFPSIDSDSLSKIKGGGYMYDDYVIYERQNVGWGYWTQMPTFQDGVAGVQAIWHPVNGPDSQVPTYPPPGDGSSGGSYGGGGGSWGGGGSGGNGTGDTLVSQVADALGIAISSGLAANETRVTMDLARLGQLEVTGANIIKNLIETNWDDFVENLKSVKGIAILDKAGKALGIVQAGTSLVKLYDDYADDGHVDPLNIADAFVSVGSLAVKSNIAGFIISAGWLIVKAEIESADPYTPPPGDYGGGTGGGNGNGPWVYDYN